MTHLVSSSNASGNILFSLIMSLACLGILGMAGISVAYSPFRARRLRLESERFCLFLQEMIIRSAHSLEPISLTLASNTVTAQSLSLPPQAFIPGQRVFISQPDGASATPSELRYARSCSPSTFLVGSEGASDPCTVTLSLRCRVRVRCNQKARS
jgi:hypothetical protein